MKVSKIERFKQIGGLVLTLWPVLQLIAHSQGFSIPALPYTSETMAGSVAIGTGLLATSKPVVGHDKKTSHSAPH